MDGNQTDAVVLEPLLRADDKLVRLWRAELFFDHHGFRRNALQRKHTGKEK